MAFPGATVSYVFLSWLYWIYVVVKVTELLCFATDVVTFPRVTSVVSRACCLGCLSWRKLKKVGVTFVRWLIGLREVVPRFFFVVMELGVVFYLLSWFAVRQVIVRMYKTIV